MPVSCVGTMEEAEPQKKIYVGRLYVVPGFT